MASPPSSTELDLAARACTRPLPWLPAEQQQALAQVDWNSGTVEEGGQFHRVLVVPDQAVLRMTRTPDAARQLPRRLALLDALAAQDLPFALPQALTEVTATEEGTAGVVQAYVPGTAHPPHSGDPQVLHRLCEVLAGLDAAALAEHTAPPFAFRGPWTEAKVTALQVLPQALTEHWPSWFDLLVDRPWAEVVTAITGQVTEWTEDPPVAPSLVHGDLAGHNMHWAPVGSPAARSADLDSALRPRLGQPAAGDDDATGWVLLGILDWDLAAIWDPALNPAYLSLWHGEEKLEQIAADEAEARRARVWLGAMAMESLYDASLRENTPQPARWPKLLRKTLPRIQRALEALQA